jgi:hypothetical protein
MAVAGAVTGLVGPAAAADAATEVCRFSDERFTEISGMTYSQRHEGVLYLHNDSSGGPYVYAVDAADCTTLATLTLAGIDARDIEAIGSGRDAKGRPVLWVADVGDNQDSWPEVRLHRLREPKVLRDRTMDVRTYRFTYPDRSHNAEALLADPTSSKVWVVTKQAAQGRIYRVPLAKARTSVARARPVGTAGGLVTDGSVSPDGSRFVLRDYIDGQVRAGLPPGSDPQTVYLPLQPQGEAITWTADGAALLVASERDNRLMRVDIDAAVPPAAASATPAAQESPAPAAAESSGSGGANAGPVALAVVLVAAAGAVIGVAEWRRRRT